MKTLGYNLWIFGEKRWFNTYSEAENFIISNKVSRFCINPQIIEVATGNLLIGQSKRQENSNMTTHETIGTTLERIYNGELGEGSLSVYSQEEHSCNKQK